MDEVRIKHLIKQYIRDNLKVDTRVDVNSHHYGCGGNSYNVRVAIQLKLGDEVIAEASDSDSFTVNTND